MLHEIYESRFESCPGSQPFGTSPDEIMERVRKPDHGMTAQRAQERTN
jgi:hypothetical protein